QRKKRAEMFLRILHAPPAAQLRRRLHLPARPGEVGEVIIQDQLRQTLPALVIDGTPGIETSHVTVGVNEGELIDVFAYGSRIGLFHRPHFNTRSNDNRKSQTKNRKSLSASPLPRVQSRGGNSGNARWGVRREATWALMNRGSAWRSSV